MPEDPKPSITADEFERSYAEAGGMTVDELRLFKTGPAMQLRRRELSRMAEHVPRAGWDF